MPRFLRNPLVRLPLIFIGVYLGMLLLGQYAGISKGYRGMIRNVSTTIFQENWSLGLVQFREPGDQFGKGLETAVDFVNREENNRAAAEGRGVNAVTVYFSIHNWGFLLGAFLIALIVASPVNIKRKAWAAGIGLLLFHFYLLFRIWLKLEWEMDTHPELGIVDLSDFWSGAIDKLNVVLVQNIVVSFLVVTIIWILVTFRKEDWDGFSKMIRVQPKPRSAS